MTTISAGLPQNIAFSPSADPAARQAAPAVLAAAAPTTPDIAAPLANTAVKDTAARLVAQQSGLAPLYADLEATIARTDLPQAVRAAAHAVLSLRMDGATADALKTAILKSGLFTEAMLVGGAAPSGDMKTALLSLRQTLQSWLGPSVQETHADPHLLPP